MRGEKIGSEKSRRARSREVWRRGTYGGGEAGDAWGIRDWKRRYFAGAKKKWDRKEKNTNREEEEDKAWLWLVEKGESWVWWAGLDWGGGGGERSRYKLSSGLMLRRPRGQAWSCACGWSRVARSSCFPCGGRTRWSPVRAPLRPVITHSVSSALSLVFLGDRGSEKRTFHAARMTLDRTQAHPVSLARYAAEASRLL
jgi:hypothetical protein